MVTKVKMKIDKEENVVKMDKEENVLKMDKEEHVSNCSNLSSPVKNFFIHKMKKKCKSTLSFFLVKT